jgi:hypothetical protein
LSYFDWLVFLIAPDYHERDQYIKLLHALYSVEFYWVIPRDKNRAIDGLDLRSQFEDETGSSCDADGPCSVLEMFIALAIRCENTLMYMYDPEKGDQTDRWFWMMLDNLGLTDFEDSFRTDDEEFDSELDDILYRFMDRDYGPNLEFCPFPIEFYVPDFEKMELAYQMNHYIKEKFYKEFR